jgi:hypothetical protein
VATYYCSTKLPAPPACGRSAVAAGAYRSGDCLVDERQELKHNYAAQRRH